MPSQNLHRIMGARFEHEKPNLCPTCAFNKPYGEWAGYCTAKRKILCCVDERVKKPRCAEYHRQADDEVLAVKEQPR